MKSISSWFIPAIPILSIYKSPLPGVDLGTMMAIMVFALVVIYAYREQNQLHVRAELLCFLMYIIAIMALNLLGYNSYVEPELFVLRNIKFIFLILGTGILVSAGAIDFKKSMQIYLWISVAASIYIIIQTLAYYMSGMALPNIVYGYTASDLYIETDYSELLYRPSSFFLEPAHYFHYNVIALVYLLFGRLHTKWRKYQLGSIVLGVLFSTSGQGYVVTILLLVLYCALECSWDLRIWAALLVAGICIWLTLGEVEFGQIDVLTKVIDRLVTSDGSLGEAWGARTGAYDYLYDLDVIHLIFGNGFGNIAQGVYYAGIPYMIHCIGIFGTIIFIGYILHMGLRGGAFTSILAVTYIGTLLIAQNFTALFICVYISFSIAATQIPVSDS